MRRHRGNPGQVCITVESIAIVGVGLIGGSLGLGLRKAGFRGPIFGVSSPGTISNAVKVGAIDRGVTLAEAAGLADVIYLSQPITGILKSMETLAPIIRPGTLVTDAGSTKSVICQSAAALLPEGSFLGGHPMAGKESRGVLEADAELFRGRPYVFSRQPGDLTPLAGAFINWLTKLGATPTFLSPDEHDRVVGLTSHLPQLAATALASVLEAQELTPKQLAISGSGLRDMTRLALSSYDIWADIVSTNTAFADHALEVYIDKLTEIRHNLQTHRLAEIFCTAADTARKIRG